MSFRSHEGAHLVKGISLFLSTRLFSYIIRLRLTFCLHRKPHRLASKAFRITCIYKVHAFRVHHSSITHPNLKVFVRPPAKVCGTIKPVVQLCVHSTSFVKVRFLTSTFNLYYSTQSDSYSFYPAISSVVITLKFVSITVLVWIRQCSNTDPVTFRHWSGAVNVFHRCQRSSVLLFDNKCCPPASAVFSSTFRCTVKLDLRQSWGQQVD